MSSRPAALLLMLSLASAGAIAERPWALQPAGSEIVFTTRQMGVPVEGRFMRFTAQVQLDPQRPESGSVLLAIDTASARFGAPELDVEVPKPAWLHAAAFPQATFRSTRIAAGAAGRLDVHGTLAIKGRSREVVVPVQLAGTVASGSFTLRRRDFNVGEGEWSDVSLLADEVVVRFRFTLVPPP